MCTFYGSFRVKAKGVIYERVHTDIGCVFILYRDMMIPRKRRGKRKGRGKKGIYIYKSTGGPLLSAVLFL